VVRPLGSEEEDRWVRELLAEWKEAA